VKGRRGGDERERKEKRKKEREREREKERQRRGTVDLLERSLHFSYGGH